MNSLIIAIVAFFCFGAGYFILARRIERGMDVGPDEELPAVAEYDGVDFVPAKHWLILFGHHFSSIAGAAPIVGPVIAVSIWGWGPVFIWIVLGSIFLGGVHDFLSLVISVKSKGRSIADIAGEVVSPLARYVFSVFVFFALVLVVAVFAYLCAKTLITDTRVIIPSVGLIPVAVIVGFLIYRVKFKQVFSTLIGLILLFFLIVAGYFFPLGFNKSSVNGWLIGLLIYAFFASITPVNILLQPRDYLSAFLLFFGIFSGLLGIVILRPPISAPLIRHVPISSQPLWPMLFVVVACGAISGFHSLIASGTTSKQLPRQRFARRIGYGAMIFEGVLAVVALLCISAGFSDFLKFQEVMHEAGPIAAFSKGFGKITAPFLGGFGPIVGVMILNAFIFTTLDTATRITRYILEEVTRIRNRWVSTGIVVGLAGFLAWGGKWKAIWPTFGASNQLVAALALLVITCWLLSRQKAYRPTFFAAVFMLVTTVAALCFQSLNYLKSGRMVLLAISVVLVILALFVFMEVMKTVIKKRRTYAS